MYFVLCLPLALLPSILPVTTRCSLVCRRSTWPKKLICRFLMVSRRDFLVCALLSTSKLVRCAVHGIHIYELVSPPFTNQE